MSRVTDLLKSAVELNLKYTSTLLHLSKDYLKDASDVVTREAAPSPPAQTTAARAPLLIAAYAGETGNAAFALNNPIGRDIPVHLVVQGELGDDRVRVDPARFTLKAGEQLVVRILASIDDKLPENQDHAGQVVAPGLSNQTVPFIVRRLPGVDPVAGASPPAAKGARTRARPAASKPAA